MKTKGLVVTFTRGLGSETHPYGYDESGSVEYKPGRPTSKEPANEACYKWLRRAGLPELKPGETVTLRVKIKRLKAGRPRTQQTVAV